MSETTEHTFEDITGRLDEIIAQVRSKDTSLERSLDLFDEAIALGSRAVELVDSFDMSDAEASMLEAAQSQSDGGSDAQAAAEGDGVPVGDVQEGDPAGSPEDSGETSS